MKHLAIITFAIVALMACGTSDDDSAGTDTTTTTTTTTTTAVPACLDASSVAPAIAEGLNTAGTLDGAQALEIDPPESVVPMVTNLRFVVTGNVNGTAAVWAVDTLDTGQGNTIFAVDDTARSISQWGADAQPGSPVAVGIAEIEAMPEVAQVRDCVR